ncbi:MAG: hypothetical protein ACHQ2Z_02500 [Elusimicrobiota bacterium]
MEQDFESLAKDIVVEKLRGAENSPALAAEIARKIAISALSGEGTRPDPRAAISGACRGAMNGTLLIEGDLAKTAVALLGKMAAVATEAHLDPADCMTWAMEGIAPAVKLAPGGAGDAVGTAIEENFMGAGPVFADLLRTSGA